MNLYGVLITSVGSLLGQNLLDALESRRHLVRIIGLDAGVYQPGVFRCDSLYLVPNTREEDEFRVRLRAIIDSEKPDLVLPARDPEILVLCDLVAAEPDLARTIPTGSRRAAEIMSDKALSYEFARRHGLPFAESLRVEHATEPAAVDEFVIRHGFPLIAKPSTGSGSLGVRVLTCRAHLADQRSLCGYVLQPFLGAPPQERSGSRVASPGVPLFTPAPVIAQFACQAVIAPDGRRTQVFCMRVDLVAGCVKAVRLVEDPELRRVGEAFADAIAEEGWRGPFNLQLLEDAGGRYCGFEMNGRMTGSTSARQLLGGDDVGELIRAWHGNDRVPCLTSRTRPSACVVRRPADTVILDADVQALQSRGVWTASD